MTSSTHGWGRLLPLLFLGLGVPATAQAAADLTIKTASVGPMAILPGETLHLKARVLNVGNTAASSVLVRACDGASWCVSKTVASIPAGGEAFVRMTLTATSSHLTNNPHFFVFTVDPNNTVTENVETNNTRSPQLPGFVINLITPTFPLPPEQDHTFAITNGQTTSYDYVDWGTDGSPSTVQQYNDPNKGQPHPVTGYVDQYNNSSGQPKVDPALTAADAEAPAGSRLVYLVKYTHSVPMPLLPALPDSEARFASANIPVFEERLGLFESVRRQRIAAAQDLVTLINQGGGQVLEYYTLSSSMLVDAPKGMLAYLASSSLVQHVEVDETSVAPPHDISDGRDAIDSDPYFDTGATGDGCIALLDSGVRSSHTLLSGRVATRFDCVNGDSDCNDDGDPDFNVDDDFWDHGTSTASIIAGNNNLGDASRGIQSADIDSLKVYSDAGLVTRAVHRGYDRAVSMGDQIIVAEMQSGQGVTGSIADDANDAFESGSLTIAANGNNGSGSGTVNSPALAHKALGIGAYDLDDNSTKSYQSRGPTSDDRIKPDIQAPTDTEAACTSSSACLNSFGGTSGATPYAAGAASLYADWFNDSASTTTNAGLIYAALINAGPDEWGEFDNTTGTGHFALPLNGTTISGTRNVSRHESEFVEFDVPSGSTGIAVSIWWAEKPSNTHRDIDLYLNKPDGTVSDSSLSEPSVFEKVTVGSPISGTRDIRIYGYSIPVGKTVTVYYNIHVF